MNELKSHFLHPWWRFLSLRTKQLVPCEFSVIHKGFPPVGRSLQSSSETSACAETEAALTHASFHQSDKPSVGWVFPPVLCWCGYAGFSVTQPTAGGKGENKTVRWWWVCSVGSSPDPLPSQGPGVADTSEHVCHRASLSSSPAPAMGACSHLTVCAQRLELHTSPEGELVWSEVSSDEWECVWPKYVCLCKGTRWMKTNAHFCLPTV